MTVLNLIRQTSRAAVLAVVLAGTALSAVPVQAAPNLSGGFSLDVKPQGGDQKQLQQFKQKQFGPNDFFNWCLTDRQIRRGLINYGFEEVAIVDRLGRNRVRVEAIYGDWYYSMRVHRCSGVVDRIRKLYPVYDNEDDYGDNWY
ncbi:MAG: hypothetical protein J0I99_02620 [Devosia sp.]|uniref:hypothetical protein n=1 Tax=Devosia sp. TaxID=1871048 RepID=UPI001AC43334|nr:hypothetical protein [Devosia sp.]MBN9314609.1 hypothetical protein [Devosia sp.]